MTKYLYNFTSTVSVNFEHAVLMEYLLFMRRDNQQVKGYYTSKHGK